ncbi:class I SAM-dependent methyltransferase [Bacillus sp. SD088]|uniref:class I SAM-dependent methyltransferase n=1 Tax=Bacillus sp. SD088 TaxID=2782012 RepID=UPI001A95F022|nr:class I SAM-dependent methyltransferase [Bacillus sp. SD088]MBO0994142.1 methyltransferase domain-containing protein [Bacillus sp. SD088]
MKNAHDAWNSKLYDQSHSFVSKFRESIITLLAPKNGERILDLGCGTGDLAQQITDLGTRVFGVDQSSNMIAEAKEKYPHIPFKVEDARSLPYQDEFDAVFSNATLHWIQPPEEVLSSIYKALVPGGRLIAEFGGKGNVQKIVDALLLQFQKNEIKEGERRIPWYFPSIGEYTTLMEKAGFHVTFAQHFDRPTPLEGKDGLKKWLNMFGDSIFKGLTTDEKDELIQGTENHLQATMFRNGQWLADYKRIRVIGEKRTC